MKKHIGIILVFLLFISGCSSLMGRNNEKTTVYQTNNGSVLFESENVVKNLCDKKSVDSFLRKYKSDVIKSEFNLVNYDKYLYQNNKDRYAMSGLIANCQYTMQTFDYTTDYNKVTLGKLNLTKDQVLKTNTLGKSKIVQTFIKSKPMSVNGNLVKDIFEKKLDNLIINNDITSNRTGEVNLVAKIIFRNYHLTDTKQINDYDFSIIAGIELVVE